MSEFLDFLPLPLYAGWLFWGIYAHCRWFDYREKWHAARGKTDFDKPLNIYMFFATAWVTGPLLPLIVHPGNKELMGPVDPNEHHRRDIV